MKTPSRTFRWRVVWLATGIIIPVLASISIAVAVQRAASDKLQRLAHVEIEAALLARQFRSSIDDLHGALLRIGIDPPEDSVIVIEQRRKELSDWVRAREISPDSEDERKIVQQISLEIRLYFIKLDALFAQTNGLSARLDRDTVVMFDDSANRLQSIADDFARAHDIELRTLLENSLSSLLWMRNLVFIGLGFLLAAVGVVTWLLYGNVVRPLREQLVDSNALLVKREKLAALGTLSAGIAHEIRNPLTAMKARLYTLRRALIGGDATEDVQAITEEVDRLERIVRDVLGYAHPLDVALMETELSTWLQEFGAFVEPELAAVNIDLTVNARTKIAVPIDPNQLRQIMLNLVRNAQEAFEGRPGKIELSLRCERASSAGKNSDIAVLSVTDNGPGIPAEIQARLFDPFFTTKPAGTGLGLSIVARLVENQGGEITFQSAPGTGTRFSVCLPIEREFPQRNPHEHAVSHLPR